MSKRKSHKKCERCSGNAVPKERFCNKCKKKVLNEMANSGYLETGGYGRKGQARTNEMKESVYETKYGTGH